MGSTRGSILGAGAAARRGAVQPAAIPRDELEFELIEALGWSAAELRAFDACLDLYLLQEGPGLRMHQLLASFLHGQPPGNEAAGPLDLVLAVQARRLVEAAREARASPADAARVARLLSFPVEAAAWGELASAAEGEVVGRALVEIGRFAAARPWFERAVTEKEQGDVHGRVDHENLGMTLHQVGYCLSRTGSSRRRGHGTSGRRLRPSRGTCTAGSTTRASG